MEDIIITLIFIGFWIFFGFGFAFANSIEANKNEKKTKKNMLAVISVIGFLMMIAGFILLIINCIFTF